MPKVYLTEAQREAELNRQRQREFKLIMTERKMDGLTHKAIAAEMGVRQETISDWKKDCGTMTLRLLRKLIKAAALTDDEVLRIVRGKKQAN